MSCIVHSHVPYHEHQNPQKCNITVAALIHWCIRKYHLEVGFFIRYTDKECMHTATHREAIRDLHTDIGDGRESDQQWQLSMIRCSCETNFTYVTKCLQYLCIVIQDRHVQLNESVQKEH